MTRLIETKGIIMVSLKNYALAATVSRVILGSVMIAHSLYLKLFIFTLSGTAAFFVSIGLPELLAYAVFFLEAICGIALILGLKTQLASLILVPVLLGATWAHLEAGWLFTNEGGGWEYPLVLSLMALNQVFLGNGLWAISKKDI